MIKCSIGPSHDPATWYKFTHAGEQVAQWDFQNKGRSRWTGTSSFVFEVPLGNLLTSMCDFVPCHAIVAKGLFAFSKRGLVVKYDHAWRQLNRKSKIEKFKIRY